MCISFDAAVPSLSINLRGTLTHVQVDEHMCFLCSKQTYVFCVLKAKKLRNS